MRTSYLTMIIVALTACSSTNGSPAPAGGAGNTTGLTPGSDGVPTAPFGGFDYTSFRGDHLSQTAAVNVYDYEGAPDGGNWQPDFAALQMLAKYHGGANVSWCSLDTAMAATPGVDCCSPDASFDSWNGFQDSSNPDAGPDSGPVVSCGQVPESWRIGAALASTGLRGLWTARALSASELRTEIVNGRPVLIRANGGQFGDGALLIIAGWSPIADGGDRFLLVREGGGFRWAAFVDIVEHRDAWLTTWTDSWYRVSATANGCVPNFDPSCGQ